MREYDHHDPDCDVDDWAETAACEAETHRQYVNEETLMRSIE